MKILLFITILEIIFSSSKPKKSKYCKEYRLLHEVNYPDCIIKLSNESKIKIESNLKKIEEPLQLTQTNLKRKKCRIIFSESVKDTCISHAPSNLMSKKVSFTDDTKNKICQDYKPKNIEDSICSFNSHFEKIYANIDHYIKNNIKETYIDSYLARLDKLIKTYSFLFENIQNIKENRSIFDPFDQKLIYILESTCVDFNADKFTKEDSTRFLDKLFDIIFEDKDILRLREKLRQMSMTDINRLFHAEFLKLSNYFGEIPELMTLGRVSFEKSGYYFIISIHLINLLICKRKHEENRIFVLFLVKKVFETSSKTLLDIFSFQEWFFYCTKDTNHLHQKNFHFFLWEIDHRKRIEIKIKLKENCKTKCSMTNLKHIRTVILLFMFQQMIFLRFIHETDAVFEKYLDLMNCIISEKNNCLICDLNAFIALLKKSNFEEAKTQSTF